MDAVLCYDYTSCNAMVSGVLQDPSQAYTNSKFSYASWVAAPGTHSVLLRINTHVGCPTPAYDCISNGALSWRLIAGKCALASTWPALSRPSILY